MISVFLSPYSVLPNIFSCSLSQSSKNEESTLSSKVHASIWALYFISSLLLQNLTFHYFFVCMCDKLFLYFYFLNFFIEFIAVTLVNKIIWVSGIHNSIIHHLYIVLCSPPKVKSPFITICLPCTLFYPPTPPSLWQSPYCCLCPWVFFFSFV